MVEVPSGLRDILPEEAEEMSKIKKNIQNIFKLYGYQEVNTPVFEYYDVLSSESSELIKREMFKLFDKDGRILGLRPEMTTPIARMVAQRMQGMPLPLRLYYVQNVFRDEPAQRGQQREFWQAGVELIGSNDPQADAEILILMIESLLSTGLRDFQINIGQIDYIKACLDNEYIEEEVRSDILNAITDGNFVELSKITEDIKDKKTRDSIKEIPKLHGAMVDKLKISENESRKSAAVENLRTVVGIIEKQGLKDYVVADLGIIRNFNYYTGIIFEGYSNNLGFPICGGGRYDLLLDEFGYNQPATGFQIGIERMKIVLENNLSAGVNRDEKVLVGYRDDSSKMVKIAGLLRANGKICLNNFKPSDVEAGRKLAREQGCGTFILSDYEANKYLEVNVDSGNEESMEVLNV